MSQISPLLCSSNASRQYVLLFDLRFQAARSKKTKRHIDSTDQAVAAAAASAAAAALAGTSAPSSSIHNRSSSSSKGSKQPPGISAVAAAAAKAENERLAALEAELAAVKKAKEVELEALRQALREAQEERDSEKQEKAEASLACMEMETQHTALLAQLDNVKKQKQQLEMALILGGEGGGKGRHIDKKPCVYGLGVSGPRHCCSCILIDWMRRRSFLLLNMTMNSSA
jgi:hypothetical protein